MDFCWHECTCVKLFGPQSRRGKCVKLSFCFNTIIYHKWNRLERRLPHQWHWTLWHRKHNMCVNWLTRQIVSKQSRTTYRSQDFVRSGSPAPVRLLWALVGHITTKQDYLRRKHTSHEIHRAWIQCKTPSCQQSPGTFVFWKICKPYASM